MTTSTIKRRRSPTSHTPPSEETNDTAATPITTSNAVISKNDSEEESLDWTTNNYINPFIHRLNIDNNVDLAKVSVLKINNQ